MRWVLRIVWSCAMATATPLGCSTGPVVVDAGADAFVSTPCSSSADCPTGTECLFPVADGCSATRHCLPTANPGACKGAFACSCTGTNVSVCNGSSVPIRSLGLCEAGPGPCSNGADCASCLACELCDVSGYSATTMSTPIASPNACSPSEIAAFVAACYGANATPQTCDAWKAGEGDAGACLGCIFTPASAAAWGPVVCTSTACSVNTPGCVDLVLGQTAQERKQGGAGSCGDLLSDQHGCQVYACNTCSTTGTAGSTDFDLCEQAAVANECKNYADAFQYSSQCAALHGDAAPPGAASCFAGVSALVDLFCGSGL